MYRLSVFDRLDIFWDFILLVLNILSYKFDIEM